MRISFLHICFIFGKIWMTSSTNKISDKVWQIFSIFISLFMTICLSVCAYIISELSGLSKEIYTNSLKIQTIVTQNQGNLTSKDAKEFTAAIHKLENSLHDLPYVNEKIKNLQIKVAELSTLRYECLMRIQAIESENKNNKSKLK